MSRTIGSNPFNLVQTAVKVAQAVAPKVAQALPEPARQAVRDTFERVARPLVQLGETLAPLAKQNMVKPGDTGGAGQAPVEPSIVEIEEPPFTDTRTRAEVEAARDTTAPAAMDWARFMENMTNTGYDDLCLGFCINAYNLHNNRTLCPEMTNAPGGNAVGAFQALQENGKIRPESGTPDPTQPLEEGTLVFFGATDKNDGDGHVCIATGRMAPDGTPEVITSGFPPDNSGVHYSSVGNLEQQSGPYVGYTTPDLAFQRPETTQG
jgi:hypothetical protein